VLAAVIQSFSSDHGTVNFTLSLHSDGCLCD